MNVDLLTITLFAVVMAAPVLLERYFRQLPIAPACPACRSIARQIGLNSFLFGLIPAFGRTFPAECTVCGWRGRMRWRFARDSAPRFRR